MSGSDYERRLKKQMQRLEWWVIRAAGSLGEGDLVLLKPGCGPIVVEVKSTSQVNFSVANGGAQGKSQWDAYRRLAKAGHKVWYAVWFKRRNGRAPGWRFFNVAAQRRAAYPVLEYLGGAKGVTAWNASVTAWNASVSAGVLE